MLFLELLSEIIIDNTLGLAIIIVVIIDKDVTVAQWKTQKIGLFIFHPQGLEEVWRIMSSVWKTPRGSNAMPEMMVKIIGSKHIRYLVEKAKM